MQACRILGAQPQMEPTPPFCLGRWSLKHWPLGRSLCCYIQPTTVNPRKEHETKIICCPASDEQLSSMKASRETWINEYFWILPGLSIMFWDSRTCTSSLCRACIWLPNNYLQASKIRSRKEASSHWTWQVRNGKQCPHLTWTINSPSPPTPPIQNHQNSQKATKCQPEYHKHMQSVNSTHNMLVLGPAAPTRHFCKAGWSAQQQSESHLFEITSYFRDRAKDGQSSRRRGIPKEPSDISLGNCKAMHMLTVNSWSWETQREWKIVIGSSSERREPADF